MRRPLVAAVFVVTALLLQACVINPLGLPGGRPDLLVVVVVALAVVGGPAYGAVLGFTVGLAADLRSSGMPGSLSWLCATRWSRPLSTMWSWRRSWCQWCRVPRAARSLKVEPAG
jgi:rod shape-determining protein MreD